MSDSLEFEYEDSVSRVFLESYFSLDFDFCLYGSRDPTHEVIPRTINTGDSYNTFLYNTFLVTLSLSLNNVVVYAISFSFLV